MLHCRHSPGITGARSRWRRRALPDGARAQGLARPSARTRAQRAGVVGKGQVPKSRRGKRAGGGGGWGGAEGAERTLPGFPSKFERAKGLETLDVHLGKDDITYVIS